MLPFARVVRRQVRELFGVGATTDRDGEEEEKSAGPEASNAFVPGTNEDELASTGAEMCVEQVERGGESMVALLEDFPFEESAVRVPNHKEGGSELANTQQVDSPNLTETPTSEASPPTDQRRTNTGHLCCVHPGCSNRAQYKGMCWGHGGSRQCPVPGCPKKIRSGHHCFKHGGGDQCSQPECVKQAHLKGKCVAHGGGKRCSHPGCIKLEQTGGKCVAHGGGKRCSHPGCTKLQQTGGKCRTHAND